MPLPSSGTLKISQIRNEVVAQGYPSTYSLRQLSNYAGFPTPDRISDFYGWPPCPPNGTYQYQFCEGCTLIYAYANGSCGIYTVIQEFNSQACGCGFGVCCDCGYGCECGYVQCDFGCFVCR